jgi:hypothetical protein
MVAEKMKMALPLAVAFFVAFQGSTAMHCVGERWVVCRVQVRGRAFVRVLGGDLRSHRRQDTSDSPKRLVHPSHLSLSTGLSSLARLGIPFRPFNRESWEVGRAVVVVQSRSCSRVVERMEMGVCTEVTQQCQQLEK